MSKKRRNEAATGDGSGNKNNESGSSLSQWGLGKLVTLSMENFLTYQQCTVTFNPCLNVIMGPNGTGKSSIVCGVCLALNGKAALLGRAKDEREFIAYGSDSARLRIELYNPEGPLFVIERVINRTGSVKNKWTLNGEASSGSAIEQLKLQLKIRIDNLCQFLPQDRVQAFSGMSDSEKLHDSINSIDPSLTQQHKELNQMASESGDYQTWRAKTDELIASFETERELLSPQVEQLKQRKEKEQRSNLLRQKRLFLIYEDELKVFNDLRERRENLEKETNVKRETTVKPLQNLLKTKRDSAINSQKAVNTTVKDITSGMRSQELLSQRAEGCVESQAKAVQQLEQKQRDEDKRVTEVNKLKQEIALIQQQITDNTHAHSTLTTPEQIAARQKELDVEIARLQNEEAAPVEEHVEKVKWEMQLVKTDLNNLNRVLHNFENRLHEKETKLANHNQHAHRAYLFVKEQMAIGASGDGGSGILKFEADFCYPMFLSLTVTDQSKSRQVEMHLQNRDLFAFVFSSKQDLDKFSSVVNDKMGLNVASLLAPSEEVCNQMLSQKPSQEELSAMNCQGVLLDFIEAPEPAKRYLVSTYQFHRTPVSTSALTVKEIDELSERFGVFYSKDRRFQNKRSKYSGEISSSEIALRDCRFLTDTIELDQKLLIQQQRNDKLAQDTQFRGQIEQLMAKLESVRKQVDVMKGEQSGLMQRERQRRQLEMNLQLKSDKLHKMQQYKPNFPSLFNQSATTFVNARQEKMTHLKSMAEGMKELVDHVGKGSLASLRLQVDQTGTRLVERQLRSEQEANIQSETELQQLVESVQTQKRKARGCWVEALKEAGLEVTVRSVPEQLQQKFDTFRIPEDLDTVNSQMDEERQQLADLQHLDETVVERHDKLRRKVEELEAQKENRERTEEGHRERLDQMRVEWLDNVRKFIEKLDSNFSRFMTQLGCSGRVELLCPDSLTSPATNSQRRGGGGGGSTEGYGLSIRVSYRAEDSTQLQQLKRDYQSGGEKSVATMLYLLALQELSSDVPFRIVDEINQGMDADNERRVFNMIVDSVCNSTPDKGPTSQYLFVTPKLLLDLNYHRNMSVLVVCNGPQTEMSSSDWSVNKFIRRHRKLTTATD